MPDESETELLRRALRLLGQRRSARKAQAARENGRLGGRPAGTVLSAQTRARISAAKRKKRDPLAETGDTPAQATEAGG